MGYKSTHIVRMNQTRMVKNIKIWNPLWKDLNENLKRDGKTTYFKI